MNRILELKELCDEFLKNKQHLIGIEIGSLYGDSTLAFINTNAFDKFYCIDPYDSTFDPNDPWTQQCIANGAQYYFDNKFRNDHRVVKIKKFSNDATYLFADESIDFIYIDGCHRYENVKQDIENYYPKIKKGGIISGHDYDINGIYPHVYGVKIAVDQYFQKPPLKIYTDMSWIYVK